MRASENEQIKTLQILGDVHEKNIPVQILHYIIEKYIGWYAMFNSDNDPIQ